MIAESKFTAFPIYHYQLKDFPSFPEHYYKGPAYWLFWNDDILLGSMLIQKSVFNGEQFFLPDMRKTIAHAVHFYQCKNNKSSEPWFEYFENGEYEKVRDFIVNVTKLNEPLPANKILPVSIIICTAGRPKDLQNCLQHIYAMKYLPQEIVVVDNMPGNPLMQQLKQTADSNIKWFEEPKKGLDIARNTGLRNASCDIIAYVDDDVVVHENWLLNIWKSYQENDIQATTGLILPHSLEFYSQYLFEQYWSFNRGCIDKFFKATFVTDSKNSSPPVWEIGAGANMSFKRDFLIKVGGFDERLDAGAAGCNGDSECWFRILLNGGTIHYNPRAIVYHKHRESVETYARQVFNYMKGFTVAAFIQKKQLPHTNYQTIIFKKLPKFYKQVRVSKSDWNVIRQSTLKEEIKGVIHGIWYYFWNRKPKLYKP